MYFKDGYFFQVIEKEMKSCIKCMVLLQFENIDFMREKEENCFYIREVLGEISVAGCVRVYVYVCMCVCNIKQQSGGLEECLCVQVDIVVVF